MRRALSGGFPAKYPERKKTSGQGRRGTYPVRQALGVSAGQTAGQIHAVCPNDS